MTRSRLVPYWPLGILLLAGGLLLCTQLGRDYLWEDEGDTAVLAATTLDTGLPRAWDGVNFTESDHGARLTDDLVMVSHPWLQYYVVAGSFAIFGRSAFAARLPFALASLGTIAVVYLLVWRATGRRRAAIAAATLLVLSTQFLIFGRQARHYALHELLTCALIWQFLRMRSVRGMLAFAAVGVLLFQAHPIGVAAVGALALVSLFLPSLATQRRWAVIGAAIVGLAAVPWLWAGARGYSENTLVVMRAAQVLPRLAQYIVECASVTPLVAVIAMAAVLFWRRRWRVFTASESALVIAVLAIAAVEAGVVALTQSRDALWVTGVRHTPDILPLIMMLVGIGLMKLARSRSAWVGLLAVLAITTVGRLTPWASWAAPAADRFPDEIATVHLPPNLVDRWLKTSLVGHVASLFTPNPGTIRYVSDYLNAHARPGDLVVTNYEWDALYFHTGLPQGMKVAPTDSSLPAVLAHELPAYVYQPGRVRWIVWRRAWGSDWGQDCNALVAALLRASVPVRLVANVPETLWENRENVHFRRYPGGRRVFAWYAPIPDAEIFRVDWPVLPTEAGGQ